MLLFICLLCTKLIDTKVFLFFVINIMILETADYGRIVETIKLLSFKIISSKKNKSLF